MSGAEDAVAACIEGVRCALQVQVQLLQRCSDLQPCASPDLPQLVRRVVADLSASIDASCEEICNSVQPNPPLYKIASTSAGRSPSTSLSELLKVKKVDPPRGDEEIVYFDMPLEFLGKAEHGQRHVSFQVSEARRSDLSVESAVSDVMGAGLTSGTRMSDLSDGEIDSSHSKQALKSTLQSQASRMSKCETAKYNVKTHNVYHELRPEESEKTHRAGKKVRAVPDNVLAAWRAGQLCDHGELKGNLVRTPSYFSWRDMLKMVKFYFVGFTNNNHHKTSYMCFSRRLGELQRRADALSRRLLDLQLGRTEQSTKVSRADIVIDVERELFDIVGKMEQLVMINHILLRWSYSPIESFLDSHEKRRYLFGQDKPSSAARDRHLWVSATGALHELHVMGQYVEHAVMNMDTWPFKALLLFVNCLTLLGQYLFYQELVAIT